MIDPSVFNVFNDLSRKYETKHCLKHEAWQNIGVVFNRFMAVVRKQFGKVSGCRVFESFENGYPHIHCILLFESSFIVFRDGKGRFRIREKDLIARGWHSNVDVQAMSSLAGGFAYLKKYLLKGIDFEHSDSKGVKTLAMCWAYRKRAFSVSGSFRKTLTDLIRIMHNSNHKLRQATLLCETLPENPFFVIGFVPQHVVRLRHSWFGLLNAKELRCISKFLLKPCQKSDCAKCISDAKDKSQSRSLFDEYDSHRKREHMTLMDKIQEKIHTRLLALFPNYDEQIVKDS